MKVREIDMPSMEMLDCHLKLNEFLKGISFIWAFTDALIFGFIAAWIYNILLGYGKK